MVCSSSHWWERKEGKRHVDIANKTEGEKKSFIISTGCGWKLRRNDWERLQKENQRNHVSSSAKQLCWFYIYLFHSIKFYRIDHLCILCWIHLLYVSVNLVSTVIEPLTMFPPTPVEQFIYPNNVLTPKNAKIIASLKSISYRFGTKN